MRFTRRRTGSRPTKTAGLATYPAHQPFRVNSRPPRHRTWDQPEHHQPRIQPPAREAIKAGTAQARTKPPSPSRTGTPVRKPLRGHRGSGDSELKTAVLLPLPVRISKEPVFRSAGPGAVIQLKWGPEISAGRCDLGPAVETAAERPVTVGA